MQKLISKAKTLEVPKKQWYCGFLKNFDTAHKETPVMTSLFSKVKGQDCNSAVKKRRHRRGFSLSFTIFFRSAIYQSNCVRLLLNLLLLF